MSIEEASTGLASAVPRRSTAYSVSMPHTFGTATGQPTRRPSASDATSDGSSLQVLTGGDALDLAATGLAVALGQQGAHEDDALALLARDLRPVVGVRGVRQIFVLPELLLDRVEQVLGRDPERSARDLCA